MKKFVNWMCAIALALVLGACDSSDGETVNSYDLSSEDLAWNDRSDAKAKFPQGICGITPTPQISLTSKSNLPAGLVSVLNMWEESDRASTALFSCQWNGQTVYIIFNILQSLLLTTYDSQGKRVEVWGEGIGTMEDFMRTSTDWKLLYCTDTSKWIYV